MTTGKEVLGMTARDERGRRVGTVVDVLFDDACEHVTGFVVRQGRLIRTRRVIPLEGVDQLDRTRMVVTASARRRLLADESAALRERTQSVQGRALVTGGGDYLGTVADVLFDEEDGRVIGFEVLDAGRRRNRVSRVGGWASALRRR